LGQGTSDKTSGFPPPPVVEKKSLSHKKAIQTGKVLAANWGIDFSKGDKRWANRSGGIRIVENFTLCGRGDKTTWSVATGIDPKPTEITGDSLLK